MNALDRSTVWPYDEAGEPGRFVYQRDAHPTGAEAERVLGELEGGEALLFPSGTGAATALLLTICSPGDTIALAAGAYYGTGVLLKTLERWGISHVEFDQTGPPPDDVQLVWLEAPSNPLLTMPDLDAAVAHPAPVVVDATASTPVYLRAARPRRRLRRPQRDEVPGRPSRRPPRRGRVPRHRRDAAPLDAPEDARHRRRPRSRLAPAARPEDASRSAWSGTPRARP